MIPARAAFGTSLVALSGAVAAVIAHVVIDVAGDFLLAHDTYDDVAHGSRAIFAVAIAALALACAACVLFDLLGRRSASAASLLRTVRDSMGPAAIFALKSAGIALLLLIGMESLDCVAAHAQIDGIDDLLGGSPALGLCATIASGGLTGWLLHALVRIFARFEPAIAAFLVRLVRARSGRERDRCTAREAKASHALYRALLLSRRGSKRGPPLRAAA